MKLLYNLPHTYLDLKVFGALYFASTLENNRTKLEPLVRKYIFLGYKAGIMKVIFWLLIMEKYSLTGMLFFMRIFFLTRSRIIKNKQRILFKIVLSFYFETLENNDNRVYISNTDNNDQETINTDHIEEAK